MTIRPWDPSLRASASLHYWNQGCPVGYFAQFVPLGVEGSQSYGNPFVGVRCRDVATTTPDTLYQESGVSAAESMEAFNMALREAPGWSWLLLLGGVILVFGLMGGRRR